MKAGGGKQKGAQFEREVCWDLSRFIDPKGEDTHFWRSAMSGGRATRQQKKGIVNNTQLGDITCVNEKGFWITMTFVIECKFYKDLEIESALLTGRGKLVKFWHEVCKLAKERERAPILIARQNRTDTLVLLDSTALSKLRAFGHDVRPIIETVMLSRSRAQKTFVCFYDEVFKVE